MMVILLHQLDKDKCVQVNSRPVRKSILCLEEVVVEAGALGAMCTTKLGTYVYEAVLGPSPVPLFLSDILEGVERCPLVHNIIYYKRVLILANCSDFVIIAKFCPRYNKHFVCVYIMLY